ncbi:MAG: hypothetical protein WCQ49_00485 [Candidatus Saccharibacteria bacterium]
MEETDKKTRQIIEGKIDKVATRLPLSQQDIFMIKEFAMQIFENKILRSNIWTLEAAIKVTIEVVYRLVYIDPKKIDLLRVMDPIDMERHLINSAEIA